MSTRFALADCPSLPPSETGKLGFLRLNTGLFGLPALLVPPDYAKLHSHTCKYTLEHTCRVITPNRTVPAIEASSEISPSATRTEAKIEPQAAAQSKSTYKACAPDCECDHCHVKRLERRANQLAKEFAGNEAQPSGKVSCLSEMLFCCHAASCVFRLLLISFVYLASIIAFDQRHR